MKEIVVIDNYDSFTFNLVHYLEDLGAHVTTYRNDEFEIEDLQAFDKILLSPGPGIPKEAGLLYDVIQHYGSKKSILGICLGMQAIGEVFGGTLQNLEKVHHGIATKIKQTVDDEILFKELPAEFEVGRYHSWVVSPIQFPDVLEITAVDFKGEIMALRHKTFNIKGVQFHPESIMTPYGKTILKNWLNHEL
ncbi:anthranilate synthase component II [Flavobacterium sp.]|jgi:anthranilate synthase component 2|uniref:anthranilate synthase component II n=1 Tax=Flavobacterium sp. TaxID=239 RepID=UPI003782FD76